MVTAIVRSARTLVMAMGLMAAGAVGPAAAQTPPRAWFAGADAAIHVSPNAFDAFTAPNVIGSPHQPVLRVTAGRWLSRRCTLRVDYDLAKAQERTRPGTPPFPAITNRATQRIDVLAFSLGFHPEMWRRAHLGFLVGLGPDIFRVVRSDYVGTVSETKQTEFQTALSFGAEAAPAMTKRLAVVGSARLNLPFGSDRAIFRVGVGARWTF